MIIPQNQFLHSQNFRSDLIEFVWRFPLGQGHDTQFILQVNADAQIYMEESVVCGDFPAASKSTFDISCNMLQLYPIVCNKDNWSTFKLPSVYNNFQNGKDLIPLITDSLNFLSE